MKKASQIILVLMLVSAFFFGGSVPSAAAKGPKILQFDTMVGIPLGLTPSQNPTPLRGVPGGGLPWMLTDASGQLRANGHLEIEVEGLVLAAGANAGKNPIASFRGLVSCVNADGTITNISTDPFPATTGFAADGGGNATIEADLTLPQPCIAPIVFVTSPTGSWFAATGH
jgi:hypothetical protein